MKVDWALNPFRMIAGIVLYWENEDERRMLEELVRKHKQRTFWKKIDFEALNSDK